MSQLTLENFRSAFNNACQNGRPKGEILILNPDDYEKLYSLANERSPFSGFYYKQLSLTQDPTCPLGIARFAFWRDWEQGITYTTEVKIYELDQR